MQKFGENGDEFWWDDEVRSLELNIISFLMLPVFIVLLHYAKADRSIDHGIACKTIFDCTVPFHLKHRFRRAQFLDLNPEPWLKGCSEHEV